MTTELLMYIAELKEEMQYHYDSARECRERGYAEDAAIFFAEGYRLEQIVERLEGIVEKCEDLCTEKDADYSTDVFGQPEELPVIDARGWAEDLPRVYKEDQ